MIKQMELLYQRSVANHAKGDQLDLSKLNFIATPESKAEWLYRRANCKTELDEKLNMVLNDQNIMEVLVN